MPLTEYLSLGWTQRSAAGELRANSMPCCRVNLCHRSSSNNTDSHSPHFSPTRLHLREMQATATARFGRAEAFRRLPVEITFSINVPTHHSNAPVLHYSGSSIAP
jgi:hypothetical protein